MSEFSPEDLPMETVFTGRTHPEINMSIDDFEGLRSDQYYWALDDLATNDLKTLKSLAEYKRDEKMAEADDLKTDAIKWNQVARSAGEIIGRRMDLRFRDEDFKRGRAAEQATPPTQPKRFSKLKGILKIGGK